MVAITATNSTTPSVQATLSRARLAQAQSEASQAESNAKQLRAAADDAQRQETQSKAKLAQLSASTQRQESTYTVATTGGANRPRPSDVPVKVQRLIENLYQATSQQRTAAGNPLKIPANAATVVNVQGQSTGRIVNVSA